MARTQPPRDRAQRAAAMQRQVGDAVLTRPSLAGVNEYSDLGRDHVPETVQYEQNPPTGGDLTNPGGIAESTPTRSPPTTLSIPWSTAQSG